MTENLPLPTGRGIAVHTLCLSYPTDSSPESAILAVNDVFGGTDTAKLGAKVRTVGRVIERKKGVTALDSAILVYCPASVPWAGALNS